MLTTQGRLDMQSDVPFVEISTRVDCLPVRKDSALVR